MFEIFEDGVEKIVDHAEKEVFQHELPFQHRLGRLLFVSVVALIVTSLAEKAYNAGYKAWFEKDSTEDPIDI